MRAFRYKSIKPKFSHFPYGIWRWYTSHFSKAFYVRSLFIICSTKWKVYFVFSVLFCALKIYYQNNRNLLSVEKQSIYEDKRYAPERMARRRVSMGKKLGKFTLVRLNNSDFYYSNEPLVIIKADKDLWYLKRECENAARPKWFECLFCRWPSFSKMAHAFFNIISCVCVVWAQEPPQQQQQQRHAIMWTNTHRKLAVCGAQCSSY